MCTLKKWSVPLNAKPKGYMYPKSKCEWECCKVCGKLFWFPLDPGQIISKTDAQSTKMFRLENSLEWFWLAYTIKTVYHLLFWWYLQKFRTWSFARKFGPVFSPADMGLFQGSFSGAISRYSRIFFARNRIKIPGVRKKIACWIFLISRR